MITPQEVTTPKARINRKDDLVVLTLDERGVILDCSKAAERLFGYLRSELMGRHVSQLLPKLVEEVLVQDDRFNPRLSFLCHSGHLFQTHGRQGSAFRSELHFVEFNNLSGRILRLIVCPVDFSSMRGEPCF